EIRYKTSIDIEGGELTNKMIDNLLRANLSTMNRYFPGMMELIYSDKAPKDLIQRIEGTEDPEEAAVREDDDDDDDEEFGPSEYRPETEPDEDDEEGEDHKRRLG